MKNWSLNVPLVKNIKKRTAVDTKFVWRKRIHWSRYFGNITMSHNHSESWKSLRSLKGSADRFGPRRRKKIFTCWCMANVNKFRGIDANRVSSKKTNTSDLSSCSPVCKRFCRCAIALARVHVTPCSYIYNPKSKCSVCTAKASETSYSVCHVGQEKSIVARRVMILGWLNTSTLYSLSNGIADTYPYAYIMRKNIRTCTYFNECTIYVACLRRIRNANL